MWKIEYNGPGEGAGKGKRRNVIEKPTILRRLVLCGPNVIEKPTTLRRLVLCGANVIEKPTTLRRLVLCGPNVIEKPTTLRRLVLCRTKCSRKTDYITSAGAVQARGCVAYVQYW